MNLHTSLRAIAVAALTLFLSPSVAYSQVCEGTPFVCDVDAAIDAGLQNLRNAERGQGHFGDGNGRHNFLEVLSFLEKRSGAGWNGRALGFEGMDPADQAMVIRSVQTMISNEATRPGRSARTNRC